MKWDEPKDVSEFHARRSGMTPKEYQQLFVGDFEVGSDEIIDRCCCECGTHFDGTSEDDYCNECFDKLPEEVFHEQ